MFSNARRATALNVLCLSVRYVAASGTDRAIDDNTTGHMNNTSWLTAFKRATSWSDTNGEADDNSRGKEGCQQSIRQRRSFAGRSACTRDRAELLSSSAQGNRAAAAAGLCRAQTPRSRLQDRQFTRRATAQLD